MYKNTCRNFNLMPDKKTHIHCRKEESSYTNIVQNEEPTPGPLPESDIEADKSDEYP